MEENTHIEINGELMPISLPNEVVLMFIKILEMKKKEEDKDKDKDKEKEKKK